MTMEFSRKYLNEAADQIDAAVFSGDAFMCGDNREALRAFMARWEKELLVWEQIEQQGSKSVS